MLERPGIKPATATPSNIMASLSLYLIILAFFIMMTTISQREGSRTQGVIASINSSFKDFPKTTLIALETADQGAGEEAAPGFEKSIEELFETAFPLAEVEISETFERIEVILPLDEMFAPGGTGIQGRHAPLLDRLADLLAYQMTGQIHEVEALLSPPAPSNADAADGDAVDGDAVDGDALLTVDRAGALARELTARGVSAAAIAIGIEQRDPGTLRLLFASRTIEPFDIQANVMP